MKSIFKIICNKRNLKEFHGKNSMLEINSVPLVFFLFFFCLLSFNKIELSFVQVCMCTKCMRAYCHSVLHFVSYCIFFSPPNKSSYTLCPITSNSVNDAQSYSEEIYQFVLWPQVRHLENSQFKISKPLLYSTCTSNG